MSAGFIERLSPRLAFAMVLSSAALGCGGNSGSPAEPPDTIERAKFIAAFVDLRLEALDNVDLEITDEERRAILEEHDITEEDLFEFVQVHGAEAEYMRDLWAEVEARILELISPDGDTVQGSAGP